MSMVLGILHAKDLGTFGETFAIEEQSLVEVISSKLKALESSGKLETHQKQIQEKAFQGLQTPAAVEGITDTKEPRTLEYDPSIVVTQDLKDSKGEVFHQKGKRINPLHTRSFTKPLLFIDGTNKVHVTWAIFHIQKNPQAKIILVKGNPFELMKEHDVNIYFDQGGLLVKKLGITHVPARVVQQGDKLLILEELPDA